MKTSILIRLALIVATAGQVHAQLSIRIDASFFSPALNDVKMVDVYLPHDYYQHPEQQHAVIYYLHGGGGNQNSGNAEAFLYFDRYKKDTTMKSPAAIFVCPDGSSPPYLGSCWVNSELYGDFEDYVMQDLLDFVESNFRVVPQKNFRFITGESMGGFGSAHLASRYPESFRGCFPFAGFLSQPDTMLNTWQNLCFQENGSYHLNYNAGQNTMLFFTMCGGLSPNMDIEPYHIEIPFDTTGQWIDSVLLKWHTYDLSRRVKDLPDENELAWFLGCGRNDYMITYPGYQVFMDSLDNYGVGYDTVFFNGDHEFDPATWLAGMQWTDSIIHHSFQTIGIGTITEAPYEMHVYPNPVSEHLTVSYRLAKASLVRITISGIDGSLPGEICNNRQQAGIQKITFNVSGYPPGLYLLRFQADDKVMSGKFVKL